MQTLNIDAAALGLHLDTPPAPLPPLRIPRPSATLALGVDRRIEDFALLVADELRRAGHLGVRGPERHRSGTWHVHSPHWDVVIAVERDDGQLTLCVSAIGAGLFWEDREFAGRGRDLGKHFKHLEEADRGPLYRALAATLNRPFPWPKRPR